MKKCLLKFSGFLRQDGIFRAVQQSTFDYCVVDEKVSLATGIGIFLQLQPGTVHFILEYDEYVRHGGA